MHECICSLLVTLILMEQAVLFNSYVIVTTHEMKIILEIFFTSSLHFSSCMYQLTIPGHSRVLAVVFCIYDLVRPYLVDNRI